MVANNPQAFLIGYLSALRNSIITVALGVSMYGFSKFIKKQTSKEIMKAVSVLPYIFSLIIVLNATLSLRNYINSLNDEDIKELPKYLDLNTWRIYEYLGWGFSFISFTVLSMSLYGYVVKFLF